MEKKKRMAVAGVVIGIVVIAGVIALSLSTSVFAQPPLPPSGNETNETILSIPTIPPDIAPVPSPTVTATPAATATATPAVTATPTPSAAIPGFGISMVVIAVLSIFVLFTLKGKKRWR